VLTDSLLIGNLLCVNIGSQTPKSLHDAGDTLFWESCQALAVFSWELGRSAVGTERLDSLDQNPVELTILNKAASGIRIAEEVLDDVSAVVVL
jgi:hypothetical protein